MGKHKKSSSKSSAQSQSAKPVELDGTPEERIAYLQRKVQSLQDLLDYKTLKLQQLRKRDIQIGKLSEKHDAQIDDLEKEHEEAFEKMEERHDRELDKLGARHEQEIDELESRQDRELEKLEAKYDHVFSGSDDDSEEDEDEEDKESRHE